MNTLFMYTSAGPSEYPLRAAQLRVGLPPVLTGAHPRGASGSAVSHLAVSPDMTKMVGTMANNVLWCCADTLDPETYSTPAVAFSAAKYAVATSNTHFAVGGDNPFLYVYTWSGLSVISLTTTGLGSVRGLAFSPDGTKLAVAHTTSPYLRLYDVAANTYVNAPASAGGNRSAVTFSSDGTRIFTVGDGVPYLSVFASDLSSLLTSKSTLEYWTGPTSVLLPHWSKPKACVRSAGTGSASYSKLIEYNHATDSATTIISPVGSPPDVTGLAYSAADNTLYAWQSTKLVAFDGTSYTPKAESVYAPITRMFTNTAASGMKLAIVERDLHKLTGTVRDIDNNPVARDIYAFRRSDALAIAKTTSHGVTGDYSLILPDGGEVDVQFRAAGGELLNDLYFARSQPAPYP